MKVFTLLILLFITACGTRPPGLEQIDPVDDWVPLIQGGTRATAWQTHDAIDYFSQSIANHSLEIMHEAGIFLSRNFPRRTADGLPTHPDFFGGMNVCDETGLLYVTIVEGSEPQANWFLHFLADFEEYVVIQTASFLRHTIQPSPPQPVSAGNAIRVQTNEWSLNTHEIAVINSRTQLEDILNAIVDFNDYYEKFALHDDDFFENYYVIAVPPREMQTHRFKNVLENGDIVLALGPLIARARSGATTPEEFRGVSFFIELCRDFQPESFRISLNRVAQ